MTSINEIAEPDSLANLVTNLDVAECAAAESAYLECVEYAIKTLNYPNVAMVCTILFHIGSCC